MIYLKTIGMAVAVGVTLFLLRGKVTLSVGAAIGSGIVFFWMFRKAERDA